MTDNEFFYQRGKLLFEEDKIFDSLFMLQRSKSAEHNSFKRSKNYSDAEFKKRQNSKKTEDI